MKKINRWFLTATLLFLIMCSVVINSKSVYADSVDVIDYVFGDVNGDKSVTAKDRIILSRYLAGWDGYEAIDEFAADVNLDGVVDTQDRIILARYVADWVGYEALPLGDISSARRTVTFDSKGGSKVDSVTVIKGTTISEPAKPTFGDNIFAGWYSDADYKNKYDFNTRIAEDITLYAKWEKPVVYYTVTFNTNGGSTIGSVKVQENTTVAEPDVPTRDGYEFLGWYSDSACTNVYDFNFAITKNTTLYAKWVKVWTVTFETNGGSYIEPAIVHNGTALEEPVTPSRNGYYFVGWYKDDLYAVKYNFSNTVSKNFTLYAKWLEIDPAKQEKVVADMNDLLPDVEFLADEFEGKPYEILHIVVDVMRSVLADAKAGIPVYDEDYILDNYGQEISDANDLYDSMTKDQQSNFYSVLLTELGEARADNLLQTMFGIDISDAKDKIDK